MWAMSGAELLDTLVSIAQGRAEYDELEARAIREAETRGVFAEAGATSPAAWLAHATKMTHTEARRRIRLSEQLKDHETVREGMAAGQVLADQASAICAAVEELPAAPGARALCEKELVGLAEHYDAKGLKEQGRKVLAIIDPEAADAHEGRLLERDERAAAKATSFSIWETGDGTVKGKFTLPILEGGMLKKALMSIAAPKHQRANGETYDHQRPTHDRLGQAFAEYVSRYPAGKLPHAGGINATVVVTMPLDTLLGGLKAATIDTGGMLSAGAVRRLACEAGIVPMVLDGDSRPLDVGRLHRFHTESQRLVLAVTQEHCQHPTCTVPAWLCHVHHKTFWIRGGKTNIKDAELLCPRHHALAHRHPPTPPSRT